VKLLLALVLACATSDEPDWPALWLRVQRLEERGAEAPAAHWAELGRQAEALRVALQRDPAASDGARFRITLLERVVAHHAAGEGPDLDGSLVPERFLPGEAFVAARHLAPGDARARAFAAALEEPPDDAAAFPVLNAAYQAFLEDEAAFRGSAARALAEAMHARARATWSASCLEGIARRQGDYATADEVLREQVEATAPGSERTELVLRRALAATGAGARELARDLLGQALVEGALDAYQMLGMEALSAGRLARARRLFGVLVERDRVHGEERAPWALRGWGVAQLPAPPTEPVQPRPGRR
jgi:hypothetical protein